MASGTLTIGKGLGGPLGPRSFAIICSTIFVATSLGIAMKNREGGACPIWITNAFLIYFVLNASHRDTWRVLGIGLAARFVAALVAGDDILSNAVFTCCNAFETLFVALPLRPLNARKTFTRPKTLLWFYLLAAGVAPFVSGIPAASFMYFVRHVDFRSFALNWYAADALGLIVIVPVLFTVRIEAFVRMFRRDQLMASLLYIGTVVATVGINALARQHPIAFLFFPTVLFLTFQRSFEGGAIGLALVSGYLFAPALFGLPIGGIHGYSLKEQMIISEIFIAVVGFSVILVGAALEERRRLEQGLAAATARAENAREEAVVAKDAAENANRMKSMFLATMSHELRTPLNAVIGFSQLMETETFGPLGDAHYREYTGLIQQAGRHLLDLINDILDMSKIEAGKFELYREEFDMRMIVADCVSLIRERAERGGIDLIEDLPADPLKIQADLRAIKQILLNLLSNAVKFTPQGGAIATRVRRTAHGIALSVEDTGVGIPAEQLYRLGNPFVQLRNDAGRAQEGTGLGLALVRSLAELHGGRFKIDSVEGKGTIVTVELPVAATASIAA